MQELPQSKRVCQVSRSLIFFFRAENRGVEDSQESSHDPKEWTEAASLALGTAIQSRGKNTFTIPQEGSGVGYQLHEVCDQENYHELASAVNKAETHMSPVNAQAVLRKIRALRRTHGVGGFGAWLQELQQKHEKDELDLHLIHARQNQQNQASSSKARLDEKEEARRQLSPV